MASGTIKQLVKEVRSSLNGPGCTSEDVEKAFDRLCKEVVAFDDKSNRKSSGNEYPVRIKLTSQEFDHVLAGLRTLQNDMQFDDTGKECNPKIVHIATAHGQIMDYDALEDLCEALNTGKRDI